MTPRFTAAAAGVVRSVGGTVSGDLIGEVDKVIKMTRSGLVSAVLYNVFVVRYGLMSNVGLGGAPDHDNVEKKE